MVVSWMQQASAKGCGMMSSMGYQQQYPGAIGPAYTRIIRRPLTDAERDLPGRFYKGLQKGCRGIALFCLILFVFSTYVLPAMLTDPVMLDSISITLSIFMAVFGLMAIGMSVNTLVMRGRISRAMMDGTAVEVFAPAYRTASGSKMPSWTIGPISIIQARGMDGLMMEGQPTSVLCLPKLKAAIAINNCGLKQGAKIMCPPNLEMMAEPVGMPMTPIVQGQAPPAAYPSFVPQQQTPAAPEEDIPPPPPDWE
jgi:hypothetical protein